MVNSSVDMRMILTVTEIVDSENRSYVGLRRYIEWCRDKYAALNVP